MDMGANSEISDYPRVRCAIECDTPCKAEILHPVLADKECQNFVYGDFEGLLHRCCQVAMLFAQFAAWWAGGIPRCAASEGA